jgi:hypothetical protein
MVFSTGESPILASSRILLPAFTVRADRAADRHSGAPPPLIVVLEGRSNRPIGGISIAVPNPRTPRLVIGAFAALLIMAGCGSGPVVTASPTASVPPSQGAVIGSALPSAAIGPTPVPTPDAVAALDIGAPFVFGTNPVNKALTESFAFEFDVADRHIKSTMNGREIRQGDALAGIALVMTFDHLTMTRDIFNAAAHGAADAGGGTVAFKTLLGEWVAIVTTKDATFGMYALHDVIVLVGGPAGTDAEALLTAVIKANK